MKKLYAYLIWIILLELCICCCSSLQDQSADGGADEANIGDSSESDGSVPCSSYSYLKCYQDDVYCYDAEEEPIDLFEDCHDSREICVPTSYYTARCQ